MKGQKLNDNELHNVVGGTKEQTAEIINYLKQHNLWDSNKSLSDNVYNALCKAIPDCMQGYSEYWYEANADSDDMFILGPDNEGYRETCCVQDVMLALRDHFGK